MKKTIAVILSLILLMSLSGCRLKDGIDNLWVNFINSGNTADDGSAEPEIEKENSITVGVTLLDTYNPLLTESSTAKNMLSFIFEPLFSLDNKQSMVGVLAQSYNIAVDGKSFRINLKPNVIWHDGTEFTAADVVYTVNTIKAMGGRYKSNVKNISSVSEIDSHTVSVSFDRPVPEPAALMTFPIIKNASAKNDFKPIGTGPFFLDYDKLTAFEAYHGGAVQLADIKIKSVPDKEKFVSLFNASVIDIASSDMLDMKSYTPRGNANVLDFTSNRMVMLGFNTQSTVFKYPEARKSVSLLLDRRNIASHTYFSRAEAVNYAVNPTSKYYPEKSEKFTADVSAAENELKNGGWKEDSRGVYYYADNVGMTYFSVTILVNESNPERVAIAEALSSAMTKVGMRNSVIKCSAEEFEQRIDVGNYDVFVGETELQPNNDLTDMLFSGINMFGYSDSETDILLEQLCILKNENDKTNISRNLYERIKSECPFAPICFMKESLVTSAKLKSGVTPSVADFVRQTEKWSVK